MSNSMEDAVAQTDEDLFSGNFCHCRHLMAIHDNGVLIKKCYALIYNGLVWSSCNCSNPRPMKFEIEVGIDANELSRIETNSTNSTKQVQLTAFKEI